MIHTITSADIGPQTATVTFLDSTSSSTVTLKLDIEGSGTVTWTINNLPGGSTSTNVTIYVRVNDIVEFTESATLPYVFDKWKVGTVDAGSAATLTHTASANTTIFVTFLDPNALRRVDVMITGTGTVSWTINGVYGSSTTANTSFSVQPGTQLVFSYLPDTNWKFVYWSIGNDGTSGATRSFTVTNDTVIQAVFSDYSAGDCYEVAVSVGTGGGGNVAWEWNDGAVVIRGSAETVYILANSNLTLTATPDKRQAFANWDIDGILSANNPLTVTITRDTNIMANFVSTGAPMDLLLYAVIFATLVSIFAFFIFWMKRDKEEER